MFAKDLRIGNYVYETTGTIQEIDAISYELVSFKNSGTARFEVIRPIPLTEEILFKCQGVGKCTTDGWLSLNICNDWTFIYFNIKQNVVELSVNHHSVILDIKYVHEFQNLIYTLTRKELNIQLC